MHRKQVVGRFAPSPSGRMHAGNIFAYLCAWLIARLQDGHVVLRIEDLDAERSKPAHARAILEDLEMLGLTWDEGPYYQQARDDVYLDAFHSLEKIGLVYPCFCTRADLHAASAPHAGERFVYPGTCREKNSEEREHQLALRSAAWRLVVSDELYEFDDLIQGAQTFNLARDCGDFVVRRFDGSFAYQLAVVVDDAAQGVNSVVRGYDLLDSSPQQRFIQDLLGIGHCDYAHIPLVVAPDGRRLAKRNKDACLDALLERFDGPAGVIGHIAFLAGIIDFDEPVESEELLRYLSYDALLSSLKGKQSIVFE